MGRKTRSKSSYYKRLKYLGKRVKDIGKMGLDRPSEFLKIKKAIIRDVRSHRISKRVARGRLLLLYRLTDPRKNSKVRGWSSRTRESIRKQILEAMRKL